MDTVSIWSKTEQLPRRGRLEGCLEVEAAVIGAGMAGVLIAHHLQRRGVQTVVLEAETVASGQTRNTTAKITAQHGLFCDKLIKTLGLEAARQYAQANQGAVEKYKALIHGHKIDCELVECPAYVYSTVAADPMRQEALAAARLGFPVEFTTETELPLPVKGAVRMENQARFHPLKFIRVLAEPLTIYERTSVQRVEGDTLVTPSGRVRARHIVFATHYPFVNVPGWYFMRMHQERSYVLALEHAQPLDGMYYSADPNGLSFRSAGDLLLLGGGNHRSGESRGGGSYAVLSDKAHMLWPQAREAARWSAQDCMTLDGVPYIGRYSAARPNWYVATGFGKWGMTSSMVSAMLISDLICGDKNPYAAVFSPQRFHLGASIKNLGTEAVVSTAGLAKGAFAPKRRCPHMGCRTEWNPDEKSWDCPCHGSRFDASGELINGPAQENMGRR